MFPVFDQDDVAALFIEAVLFSFLFFIYVSNIHTSLSLSVARARSLSLSTHTHRMFLFGRRAASDAALLSLN